MFCVPAEGKEEYEIPVCTMSCILQMYTFSFPNCAKYERIKKQSIFFAFEIFLRYEPYSLNLLCRYLLILSSVTTLLRCAVINSATLGCLYALAAVLIVCYVNKSAMLKIVTDMRQNCTAL